MQKLVLTVVLIAFGGLSLMALRDHGYVGLFTMQLTSFGGAQVLADLCIALALVLTWLWRDARASGRNPWPWVVLTVATGSFGPLGYLLTRKAAAPGHSSASKPQASTS